MSKNIIYYIPMYFDRYMIIYVKIASDSLFDLSNALMSNFIQTTSIKRYLIRQINWTKLNIP